MAYGLQMLHGALLSWPAGIVPSRPLPNRLVKGDGYASHNRPLPFALGIHFKMWHATISSMFRLCRLKIPAVFSTVVCGMPPFASMLVSLFSLPAGAACINIRGLRQHLKFTRWLKMAYGLQMLHGALSSWPAGVVPSRPLPLKKLNRCQVIDSYRTTEYRGRKMQGFALPFSIRSLRKQGGAPRWNRCRSSFSETGCPNGLTNVGCETNNQANGRANYVHQWKDGLCGASQL